MAHELDGDWRFFIIRSTGAGPLDFDIREEVGKFHLDIDVQTGSLKSTSTHGSNALTGVVIPQASGKFKILISEKVSMTQFRPYQGFVIIKGDLFSLASGTLLKLTSRAPVLREGEVDARAALAGQEDGTWVATRP